MKIGLIDVDGRVKRGTKHNGERYPNLALMKISSYHKANGDSVEMCFPMSRYDRIYASKIFTFSPDIDFEPQTSDFRFGGTGYNLTSRLPDEIEHMMPDYSLYDVKNTAYGFLSRGCPRGCPFCIVAAKEGRASHKVADLREWWNGQKEIKLLDPNLLACADWEDLLGQLVESGARVDFSQGLDLRLMTERKAEMLNKVRTSMVHFAWDGNEDLEPYFRKWSKVLRWSWKNRRVYVLTNFNTTHEYDMHRVMTLLDCGYDPFVMVYDKEHASNNVRRFQRWVNNKAVFRTVKWIDYK